MGLNFRNSLVGGLSAILLAAPEGEAWCGAARNAATRAGVALHAYRIGGELRDPTGGFASAYGLSESGAALIRPDGFVAWRAKARADDPQAAMTRAFDTILARA